MAIDIDTDIVNWSDIVGEEQTVEDGGYVGDLLAIAMAHVSTEVLANRLTQAQAGIIYTEMIPAAFANAIKFGLGEALVESQIADVNAGIELKYAQLAADKNLTEAQLEKEWGYDVTRDAEDELILGASTDLGKIDEQVDLLGSQDLDVISKTSIAEDTSEKNLLILQEQIDKLENENRILANKT